MGKASSNKKVARVARTGGGRTARGRGSLLWPGVLTLTVVLGTFLIFYSRDQNQTTADNLPPQRGDHWHAAYGFYDCNKFLPPITDQNDPIGVHTHGDGVIHVHPTSVASSGKNATLARFMDAVNGKVSSSEIKVPGQKTMKNGMKCGKKEARVEVRTWAAGAAPGAAGKLIVGNPANLRFTDRQLITVAFVPAGTNVPPPESAPQLNSLSDVAPTATVPVSPEATAPGPDATTAPPDVATTAPGTPAPGP
jgi:hypothetical protein